MSRGRAGSSWGAHRQSACPGDCVCRDKKQCHSWLRAPYQKTHKRGRKEEKWGRFELWPLGLSDSEEMGQGLSPVLRDADSLSKDEGLPVPPALWKPCLWIHFKGTHNPKEPFDPKSMGKPIYKVLRGKTQARNTNPSLVIRDFKKVFEILENSFWKFLLKDCFKKVN